MAYYLVRARVHEDWLEELLSWIDCVEIQKQKAGGWARIEALPRLYPYVEFIPGGGHAL